MREEQPLLGHLLQGVVDRPGLGVGPLVRAPVLQVVADLVAVRAAVHAHSAEDQQPDRGHGAHPFLFNFD
ncbi:hypothetical protein Smic_34550 [Streptomyces microflavus]|uniref:Uncharacterized protein n=1 Tax=Streptomyces microflavus TaxID=1919 RepID=A0A7J0CR70_STRMI|nr:hypothetical protein Smic_34550 [Streptomyces microflavus]